MTQLQVTLPDAATDFIAHQVATGEFGSPSEYLAFLVEQARAATARRGLEVLLDEGLDSGEPIVFTPEWWRSRKAQLLATLPAESGE